MTTLQVGSRGSANDALPRTDAQDLLLPGHHEQVKAVERASHFLIPVGTHWVERDVLFVSEEITRRWPNLAVVSCSCCHCLERGHHPHMVVESCRDGQTRPVFGFAEFGRHVIEQLAAIHVENSGGRLDQMRRHNEKIIESRAKKAREQSEEAAEVVVAALRSHKHDWRGPNGLRTQAGRGGRVL